MLFKINRQIECKYRMQAQSKGFPRPFHFKTIFVFRRVLLRGGIHRFQKTLEYKEYEISKDKGFLNTPSQQLPRKDSEEDIKAKSFT